MVVFCVDDYKFDGFNKLFWAIAFKNQKILQKWKKRFEKVKYVAAPDYSVFRDMPLYWQIFNIAKSRIVMLWLELECGLTCIPCASWGSKSTLDWCFDGIEKESPVFLNMKGIMKEKDEKKQGKEAIRRLIDTVHPNPLIVYTVSSTKHTLEFLSYAVSQNIQIVIPDNCLKERNEEKRKRQ